MLGVASYNLITVATGATLGSVEATPNWDIAGAWVIVQASDVGAAAFTGVSFVGRIIVALIPP